MKPMVSPEFKTSKNPLKVFKRRLLLHVYLLFLFSPRFEKKLIVIFIKLFSVFTQSRDFRATFSLLLLALLCNKFHCVPPKALF